MLREAEDDHHRRRIGFVTNLYQGDTIPEAADREGRSPAPGTRWAEDWTEGGFDELRPSFGGGRPPKLDEDEHYLGTVLRELGLSYAKPRPQGLHRPENSDEILDERVDDASTRASSHTTHGREKTRKAGLVTRISVLTVDPSSGFLMGHSHSRTIIAVCLGRGRSTQ